MLSVFQRLLLAVALGLGVLAGLARAGEPGAKPAAVASEADAHVQAPPQAPVPAPAMMEDHVAGHPHAGRLKPVARPRLQAVGETLRGTVNLCYSHFNDFSCGGLFSELGFHFGSCRLFFGERCLRRAPPSIVPGFDPQTMLGPHYRRSCPICE